MILCLNFSRPWEGEEIAETITLLQKTSETAVTTGLIALENLMQCDIAQLSWWSISLMTTGNPPRFESNQGLQRAAVLPSTWAAAPCHWTRRMILTRSDKKLLTPHWHLGQIGWMTRWVFLYVIILFFANSSASGLLVREGRLDGDTPTGTTQALVALLSSSWRYSIG